MKNAVFLLPCGVLKPSSLFTAIEVLEMANRYWNSVAGQDCYKISIAGCHIDQALLNGNFQIRAVDISSLMKVDLIFIPAIWEHNDNHSDGNRTLSKWVVDQYQKGAEIASLCTGTFFLAATGLLDNMECTTHWKAEESFTAMYPSIKLSTDKIITDNNGVYTAGGAASSLNLMLYLVEKFNGRETALFCAKVLQIDIERSCQSTFILFEGQKNHPDKEIRKIQEFIEGNIEDKITVESLAQKFLINKRSLIRRFKKATNNLPNEYIQRVKIEAAKRSLELGRQNVKEIMYTVGYTDSKAFRTTFKKVTGLTPAEYKTKFSSIK